MYKVLKIDSVVDCLILERINKFVVSIIVNDTINYAYLCNTGRLHQYIVSGRRGYCIRKRSGKTSYRLFAIDDPVGYAAIVDTNLQMKVFEECVSKKLIPWLSKCLIVRRNVRVDGVVIDYLLECGDRMVFLEAKSAVMRSVEGYAMYPDTRSLRGERHVRKLIDIVVKGGSACILFIAGIPFAKAFKPNRDVSELFYKLLLKAVSTGVIVKAIGIYFNPYDSTICLYDNDMNILLNNPQLNG